MSIGMSSHFNFSDMLVPYYFNINVLTKMSNNGPFGLDATSTAGWTISIFCGHNGIPPYLSTRITTLGWLTAEIRWTMFAISYRHSFVWEFTCDSGRTWFGKKERKTSTTTLSIDDQTAHRHRVAVYEAVYVKVSKKEKYAKSDFW